MECEILFGVVEGFTIYTDELRGIEGLVHYEVISLNQGKYVNDRATTNSIES